MPEPRPSPWFGRRTAGARTLPQRDGRARRPGAGPEQRPAGTRPSQAGQRPRRASPPQRPGDRPPGRGGRPRGRTRVTGGGTADLGRWPQRRRIWPGRNRRNAGRGLRIRLRGEPGCRGDDSLRCGQHPPAGGLDRAMRRELKRLDFGPAPHPGDEHDLFLLGQRRKPAPGARLAQVTHLGGDELGQSLALQDRPGGKPGQHPRGENVKPERRVTKREAENCEDNHIGDRDCGENCDLAHRQRHRQPEVVQLVEPFLDPPDIGIGGQIHQLHPFRLRGYQWTPSAFAMPVASVCTMLGV